MGNDVLCTSRHYRAYHDEYYATGHPVAVHAAVPVRSASSSYGGGGVLKAYHHHSGRSRGLSLSRGRQYGHRRHGLVGKPAYFARIQEAKGQDEEEEEAPEEDEIPDRQVEQIGVASRTSERLTRRRQK